MLRAELQFPFAASSVLHFGLPEFPAQQGTGLPQADTTNAALLVSPYLFGAYGRVTLHQPTILEQASSQGASYGAGIRLGAGAQSIFSSTNLNLEYGRTQRFGSGTNNDRFSLTAAFQF